MKTLMMEMIYSAWRLTAGAGLASQKGLRPILPQSARLSFRSVILLARVGMLRLELALVFLEEKRVMQQ